MGTASQPIDVQNPNSKMLQNLEHFMQRKIILPEAIYIYINLLYDLSIFSKHFCNILWKDRILPSYASISV